MTDSVGEFCSDEFSRYLQSQNILSTVIPTEAHWQMGKCERHGALLQGMLNKYQVEHPIVNEEDFDNALSQLVTAKNSLSRHRGYSPEILVLGKSRHVPACVSNDDEEAADWLDPLGTDPEMQWFRENLQKRETARKSFIAADHDQRLRRAYLRRSRPSRGVLHPGDHVMFWRDGKGNLPAKVIIQEDDNIIWISHMSRLYCCAPEHIRNLTSRETEGMTQDSSDIPENRDISNGVFQYHDLTRQSGNIPVESNSIISLLPNKHDQLKRFPFPSKHQTLDHQILMLLVLKVKNNRILNRKIPRVMYHRPILNLRQFQMNHFPRPKTKPFCFVPNMIIGKSKGHHWSDIT